MSGRSSPDPFAKAANRRFVRRLSPRARRRLAALVPARAFAWFRRRRTDVYLVSFPKCGRTWLRVLVGRAFQQHFGLPADANLVELHRLVEVDSRVPCVFATHDDDGQPRATSASTSHCASNGSSPPPNF